MLVSVNLLIDFFSLMRISKITMQIHFCSEETLLVVLFEATICERLNFVGYQELF